jgi:adenylate kinase
VPHPDAGDGRGAHSEVSGRRGAACAPPDRDVGHPYLVPVLGAPGAGKGTQCAALARDPRFVHLSMGEILRAEIAGSSPLGRQVRAHVRAGDLVPDQLAVDVALAHIVGVTASAPRWVLLDGFPRTVAQAEALDALRPDAVWCCVHLSVPRDQLIRRLATRGRHDDTASAIRQRLAVYRHETRPMIERYARQGLLRHVDGAGSSAEVAARVREALDPTAAGHDQRLPRR